jgi:hypothetical protein
MAALVHFLNTCYLLTVESYTTTSTASVDLSLQHRDHRRKYIFNGLFGRQLLARWRLQELSFAHPTRELV